jgi:hypothetical protein
MRTGTVPGKVEHLSLYYGGPLEETVVVSCEKEAANMCCAGRH